MAKVRVHELARELNVETKVLMTRLQKSGVKVASHQSTLTDQQVADLRAAFGTGAAAPAAPSAGAGSSPKVVIRRRAATTDADVDAPVAAEPAVAEPEAPARPAAAVVTRPAVVSRPAAAKTAEPVPPVAPAGAPEEDESEAEEPAAAAPAAPAAEAPAARVAAPVAADEPAPEPEPEAPRAAPPAPAVRPAAPAAPAASAAPAQPAVAAAPAPARRRELGGATIVRRATAEERENLETANRQRQTGRKEDHRGTRVTGLGLLSNRVSAAGAAPGGQTSAPPPPPGVSQEDWDSRRATPAYKDAAAKKAAEEAEEHARKKAAANKARRSNAMLSTRALLDQVDDLMGPDDSLAEPAATAASAPSSSSAAAPASRTVYTPSASRNRRDMKRRKDLKKTQITTPRAAYRVVEMEEFITVGELARQLAVKAGELIKKLMGQGVMATINQSLDVDTATLIANDYGFEVKTNITTAEDILKTATAGDQDLEAIPRPPIVTVMGHVDHGKTSILDAIRSANVASGEAGGITQHIGAYSVMHGDQKITFLDTPGHEAFSAMRARGAKVTDIVILVVAADDGVMPQTVEAINHAKAAGVPIIVAVNKIDKPQINLDRVYTELTEHGIQAEEWGGETQFIKVSALQRTGIDDLLEALTLQTEVLDLKARADGNAEGAVVEAHLDKGRGPVATIIVQRGTLKTGDYLVAGTEIGRVRAMSDHNGKEAKFAGPSDPVEIIGLSGVPMAGDSFNVCSDEKTAREVAEIRVQKQRALAAGKSAASTLEDLLNRVKSEDVPEVPIIVKADTQGSVEAISESIRKLNTPKVKNRIVHAAVGGVSESDITLAQTSGAMLIAFNVRAGRGLDEVAEKSGVVIKYFSIIYEIVDAVKAIMVGKLPPIVSEVVLGHAEVRKPISVPKIGTIAGSAVLDGKITRASHCRLIRNSIVIYVGRLGSLRRFKDDVKEVAQGYECGIGIDGYNDLKEGDVIEAYVLEETAATL